MHFLLQKSTQPKLKIQLSISADCVLDLLGLQSEEPLKLGANKNLYLSKWK